MWLYLLTEQLALNQRISNVAAPWITFSYRLLGSPSEIAIGLKLDAYNRLIHLQATFTLISLT